MAWTLILKSVLTMFSELFFFFLNHTIIDQVHEYKMSYFVAPCIHSSCICSPLLQFRLVAFRSIKKNQRSNLNKMNGRKITILLVIVSLISVLVESSISLKFRNVPDKIDLIRRSRDLKYRPVPVKSKIFFSTNAKETL